MIIPLLAILFGNAVTIISFTILSIYFDNPWLVMLALFFFQNYKIEAFPDRINKNQE